MGNSTYLAPATGAAKITTGVEMIRAEHVHVRYRVYEDVKQTLRSLVASAGRGRKFKEVHAVNDISFSAKAGDAIGIIGPNGSGKSTLMQAISGLLPVNEGAVYARTTPMLLGVGAVLNRSLSGRRNIMLGGLALGLSKQEVLDRQEEIIKFAGIGNAIDRPMKTYSSGMSARLQFAISAAVKPEILIIDEALSVGDREFKEKSRRRMEELRDSAGTLFLVSHSMPSILDTCTRVIWLQNGVVQMDGDPEEVVDAYNESDHRRVNKAARKKRKAQQMLKELAELEPETNIKDVAAEVAQAAAQAADPSKGSPPGPG